MITSGYCLRILDAFGHERKVTLTSGSRLACRCPPSRAWRLAATWPLASDRLPSRRCCAPLSFTIGDNSALKSLASGLGFVHPPCWACENGSIQKTTGLVPETTNTTLYSGSFGSGVDEERS